MSRVIDMLGFNERIKKTVLDVLGDKLITRKEFKDLVKAAVDSYAADVYSNMKEIEHQKYKLVEYDIQLGNLAETVKTLQEKGGIK